MDYRTSDYPTTSSTVLLSLLLEHTNDIAHQGPEPSDTLDANVSESEYNNPLSDDAVPKTEDGLSAVNNNLDYENSGDLKNHFNYKKRRTSAEHPDVEPTTKRGLPPTDFTKRSPSWYYITKSDIIITTEIPNTEPTEEDASIETTQSNVTLESSTTDSTTEYTNTESAATDLVGEGVTMSITSTPEERTQSDTSKSSPVFVPAVTPIFGPTERSGFSLPTTNFTDPDIHSVSVTIGEAINATSESPSTSSTSSENTVDSSTIGDVGTRPIGTSDVPVTLTSSTEPIVQKSETESVQVPTESSVTSTTKETVSSTELAVAERSETERRREHIVSGSGRQFGRKVSRRPINRNYFTELRETNERRAAEEEKRRSQRVRARIPGARGTHRYQTVITTKKSDDTSEGPIVEEKDERLKVEAEAEGRPLTLDTTENSEVTTVKSTRITSRTSAALSTRLRKVSSTVAPREASGSRRTTLPEPKVPAKDVIIVTEGPKRNESVDQSSRAQELAVTTTDPPPSQAPSTGRLPTRETLRRKISTTVAPRADTTTTTTTTSRSTVRFRGRQKNKKEKSLENVTTRPRRPAVVDYDYYEDELEPVVAKSTLNGKLFLTSRGTIRCLDQGNFPHPYSCKKFITCARMVNGQVIGAEYTCPDKLSFDPIGGICNWSAGLGCKE